MRYARFGLSLSDLTSPLDDALNAIGDVVEEVPGGEWILDAGDAGLDVLRDVARFEIELPGVGRLPIGIQILRAMTGTFITPQVARVVGPQLAAFTIAIPGLIKGECFIDAFIKEASWRIQTLIAVLGSVPGLAGQVFFGGSKLSLGAKADEITQKFANEIKRVTTDPQFRALFDRPEIQRVQSEANLDTRAALERLRRTPTDVAARFNARPDVAALAINLLLCERVYGHDEFAVVDGAPKRGPLGKGRGDPRSAQELAIALELATQQKKPQNEIDALRARYLQRRDYETRRFESSYLLERVASARGRNAPPAIVNALQVQYENALRQEYVTEIAASGGPFVLDYGVPPKATGAFGLPLTLVAAREPTADLLTGALTLAVLLSPLWISLWRGRAS